MKIYVLVSMVVALCLPCVWAWQPMVITVARDYANVSEARGVSYYDYPRYSLTWNDPAKYVLTKFLGRGKYGEVFAGLNSETNDTLVVKVLKPIRKEKLKREVSILRHLAGGVNIIGFIDVVRDAETRTPSYIFELVEARDHREFYGTLSPEEVRYYLFEVLRALEYAHSQGIIHRDVKPHNIMINHAKRQVRLIDWGLAEYYLPEFAYNVRVASRAYKSPELLVGYPYYDYGLDMWSFGCVMATMLFSQGDSFFPSADNIDQLRIITKTLGTEDLITYLKKYNIVLGYDFNGIVDEEKPTKRKPFRDFVNSGSVAVATDDALDLLDHLLVYDHYVRYTAREAMAHPYFDSVRNSSRSIPIQ